MDYGEHREAVRKSLTKVSIDGEDTPELSHALYAASEMGLFEVGEIEEAAALEIWRAVESVRRHGFPKELGM